MKQRIISMLAYINKYNKNYSNRCMNEGNMNQQFEVARQFS